MSLVAQFLSQIRQQVRSSQGDLLRSWLQVEPESHQQYHDLAAELRARFAGQEGKIDDVVERALPQEDDLPDGQATAWPGLLAFVKDYLAYWRDVDFEDLLAAHQLLSGLVNSCATAFAHPTYGSMLLQVSMSLSETLARLTMTLNRRPDLTRRLRVVDDDSRKSVAESSAEIIQKIFTTCLTDRTGNRTSRPEGKRVGVYMFANLVLKLLFACRRTQLAKMIFVNIESISPPLSLYPAAQRVTFLYYLGRFNFSNHHYRRAALCLEQAYLQTPRALASHRANILAYLVPANMLLGRFPSPALLARPESRALGPVFRPLCLAARAGNFPLFQAHLAAHEPWLLERGLLVPLASRMRPLLWRALARKTFLLTYVPPADASSRRAATLDLADLHAAALFCQRRIEGWLPLPPLGPGGPGGNQRPRPAPHANPLLVKAVKNSVHGLPPAADGDTSLAPPPGGPRRLRPNEGLVWGNAAPTPDDVEMAVAALVEQGLMHGFVAHSQARFAIIGAKAKGSPVLAGWPNVWQTIRDRRHHGDFDMDEVPGWVKL
ncbi:PCI domain-containing protein [Escovopsis weberi]|uniref:PCI domain-containing protein n=1 Tax=Escovopsis weberi TaxID=150374 RepID=A0A0M8MRR4_ESCWE|nr:PCI domain-containing protein [Escovopsis weberi]